MGWRDPFIFERKGLEGNGCEWGMLLGSGLKDGGGAVMIYRSENLRGGAARARAAGLSQRGRARAHGRAALHVWESRLLRAAMGGRRAACGRCGGEAGVLLQADAPCWANASCSVCGVAASPCDQVRHVRWLALHSHNKQAYEDRGARARRAPAALHVPGR